MSNEEELDAVIADEYLEIRTAKDAYKHLPRVRTADEATRPLGHGSLQTSDLNFDIMVQAGLPITAVHSARVT